MPVGNDTHISIAEAAREIGVSPSTIRRWITEERFKDVRRPSERIILVNREEVLTIKNQKFFAPYAP